jgi:hypothetical protein
MNLGELCADVYVLTNRNDLVSETQLAIRAAARKFHLWDFWMRDLQERVLAFDASGQNFSFDIPSNFQNWRKFSYIRPVDPISGVPFDRYINPVSADKVFDEFGRNKTDVFYVAGTKMNMKTSDSQQTFLFGWYTIPNLSTMNFSSWLADLYPELLIYEAAGYILQIIGQVEAANKIIDPQKGIIYNPLNGMLKVLQTNELEPLAR